MTNIEFRSPRMLEMTTTRDKIEVCFVGKEISDDSWTLITLVFYNKEQLTGFADSLSEMAHS